MKKLNQLYKCPRCITNKKVKALLQIKKKGLECKNCKDFFPFYKNLPVMLLFDNDFYHLKKALTNAIQRVNKYESKSSKIFT